MLATKPKVVPNNKMKVVKQKTKKKMTAAQDAAYDRKHGIKAGSKQDKAMDQKNGVAYKKKAKSKKLDMSTVSGHNSAKQNGGSESKLNKGKNSGQKAYLKRVGTKGMQC